MPFLLPGGRVLRGDWGLGEGFRYSVLDAFYQKMVDWVLS